MNPEEKIKELEEQIVRLRAENMRTQVSNSGWQVFLEAAGDAVFIAETDTGFFVEANQKAADLLGYRREELVGLHQTQIHPEDKRDEYAETFRGQVAMGMGVVRDVLVQCKDGTILPVDIHAGVFAQGDRRYIVGFFRDVQEFEESRMALLESRARYKLLFDAANDGIFVYHPMPDGMPSKFVEVNDAACRMLGYSKKELLNFAPADLTVKEDWDKVPFIVEQLKRTGHAVFTLGTKRKDGKVINVEIHDHIFELDGRPAVMSLARDISERLAVENKLRETQAKLMHADKMAALGQLVAGVAHEVNNTINFISGALPPLVKNIEKLKALLPTVADPVHGEAASAAEIFPKVDTLVANMREGVRRTINIVQELKLFAHKKGTELVRVNAHDILETTLSLLYREYKTRITVTRDLAAENPYVLSYPDTLPQVFLNLLLNAMQAIADRGEIRISSWNAGGAFYMKFVDTGVGIAPEVQGRIFEPFFTTKQVGDGSGLGLSVCYNLMKKNKGDISFQSTPGVGTEFVVSLALAPRES